MTWTHRERILAALNHEEADRVAIDFGGAEFTSITLAAYEKLKRYLHVDEPTDPMSIIHSVAHPAEKILEKFGVDTRNVQPGPYEAGPDHWIDDNNYVDVFGVLWNVGPHDIATLDRFEGVHDGRYDRRMVHVTANGRDAEQVVLFVDRRDQPGQPRTGYMEKVLAGATSFGLPDDYLGHLSSFALEPQRPVVDQCHRSDGRL